MAKIRGFVGEMHTPSNASEVAEFVRMCQILLVVVKHNCGPTLTRRTAEGALQCWPVSI